MRCLKASLMAIVLLPLTGAAQTFDLIEPWPGVRDAFAWGMSSDGRVIVGYSESNNGGSSDSPGYFWSRGSGRVDFGYAQGQARRMLVCGVSGDGQYAVGWWWNNVVNVSGAFRYRQGGVYEDLGVLPRYRFARGADANQDGSVVVGWCTASNQIAEQAFVWTPQGGMRGLGFLTPNGFNSHANAITPDGSVIVGHSEDGNGERAFRWTEATGMVQLPDLPGSGSYGSVALGVSDNGRVVIGRSGRASEGVRWHDGMVETL